MMGIRPGCAATAARRGWQWLCLLWVAAALALAGCSDSPPPAPQISVQPSDTAAAVGQAATFSVTASGPDIAYQWQVSSDAGSTWADLPGATSASYTTDVLSLADSGRRYRVVVAAAGVELTSSAVTLTVTPAVVAPAITVQPPAVTVVAPANAVFSVTATGTTLAYQWQRSTDAGATWADIAGATAATHDAGPTTTAMDGQRYRVVVGNSAGSVTSAVALLTVEAAPIAPAFTSQPTDQSVAAGASAAFSVMATGTPAPTLQWQRSTDGGSTWSDIAGAIDPTFNTGATTLAQDGHRYRATASNASGTATSTAARLTVTASTQAPAITQQPLAQTVTAPASATFTAAASGVPSPTWQWMVSTDGGASFANIAGATAASYTTPATSTADSGKRYRAVATNSAGTAATDAVTLTVNAPSAQWGTAVELASPAGWTVGYPRVAAADGRFIAAWLARDPVSGTVQARVSRHDGASGWSVPEVAASWTGPVNDYNRSLAVAMALDGTAVLTWLAPADGRASVFASRQSLGGAWSSPNLLEAVDGGDARNPAVVVDGHGTATVVWNQVHDAFFESTTTRLLAARQPVSGIWESPVDIDLPGANGNSVDPFVAANAGGDVVVAWTTSLPVGQFATANVWRGSSLGWTGAVTLTEAVAGRNSVAEDAGINDAGLVAVAMNRVEGGVASVLVARHGAGVWSAAEEVDQTVDYSFKSSIAVAPDGSLHVAFRRDLFGGFNQEIWATSRPVATGAWSTPVQIFGTPSGDARVRSDGSGNAMAIWTTYAGSAWVVRAARRPAGGSWGAATVIESQPSVNSTLNWYGLAVSPNGHAAAVWAEGVPGSSGAASWANVYR